MSIFASFYSVLFYTSLYPTVVNVEVCFLIEFANVVILIEIVGYYNFYLFSIYYLDDLSRQYWGKTAFKGSVNYIFNQRRS